jgi:hypothetical protein
MTSLESLRRSATDGVADWLSQLVENIPNLAPKRADPTVADPAVPEHLNRFVHGVLTTNPDTRDPLPAIHIFLIELALGCVDWEALARDSRFRHFDWSQARLIYP